MKSNISALLATITLLAFVLTGAQGADLHKYASDFALGYHACLTTQVGLDYFKTNINTVFNEYIERYNSNRTGTEGGRVYGTSESSPYHGLHYRISRVDDGIEMVTSQDRAEFVIKYDARTESDQGKANVGGEFKLALVVVQPTQAAESERKVPQLKLELDSAFGMAPLIFTFEKGKYFDQPPATRMLIGFVRTINEYIKEAAQSAYLDFDFKANNLQLLLNCNETDLEFVQTNPVPADTLTFGISNNIMNLFLPYTYQIRFNRVVSIVYSMQRNYERYVDEYGLRLARGKFSLTKEPPTLDSLKDSHKMVRPYFQFTEKGHNDTVDTMKIQTGIFVQFEDYTNKTVQDFVIAPIELAIDVNASTNETTREFWLGHQNTKFKFRKCDFTYNQKVDESPEAIPVDEGEFDDDDDEEVAKDGKRKFKLSNYQQLLCGFKSMLPVHIKNNHQDVQSTMGQYINALASMFVALSRKPLGDSYTMQCAGIGIQLPETRFEKNRIIVSVKLNQTVPAAPDGFCDVEDQELFKFDPRTIDAKHKKKLDSWMEFEHHFQQYHWFIDPLRKDWFGQNTTTSLLHFASPLVQRVASHYFVRDHCLENYPTIEPTRCALTISQFKPISEYNKLLTSHYRDFDPSKHEDLEEHIAALKTVDDIYEAPDGGYYSDEAHYDMVMQNEKVAKWNQEQEALRIVRQAEERAQAGAEKEEL